MTRGIKKIVPRVMEEDTKLNPFQGLEKIKEWMTFIIEDR
jgi:hypothetical protein